MTSSSNASSRASESTPRESGVDESTTRAVTESVFDAFRAHDLDAFRDLLAEDAVLLDASTGAEHTGPDTIVDVVSVVLTALPDLNPDVQTMLVDGANAAVQVVRTGTHTGPLQLPDGTTVPPTGREVRLPEAIFLHVENGKVASMTTYVDRAVIMEEFGLT